MEERYEIMRAKFLTFDKASGSRWLDDEKLLAFIREELHLKVEEVKQDIKRAIAEVEEIIVDAEGLAKFPIGSVDLHTTIGGNAGTRRAAGIFKALLETKETI